MEIHDGDGLRTTVFFKGCPLKCLWCHNPESIGFHPQTALYREPCIGCGGCAAVCPTGAATVKNGKAVLDPTACTACFACVDACPTGAATAYGTEYTVEALVTELKKDAPFFQNGGGGITLSGGECLAQPAFAVAVAKALHEQGISVFVDTCGYVDAAVLDAILPYTDTFLYDIKAINGDLHRRLTGRDNARILENVKHLSDAGARIEIRYPLIAGYNDGECAAIGEFLQPLHGIVKVKVLRYHRFAASRYEALGMENTLPDTTTTTAHLQTAVTILRGWGLNATTE